MLQVVSRGQITFSHFICGGRKSVWPRETICQTYTFHMPKESRNMQNYTEGLAGSFLSTILVYKTPLSGIFGLKQSDNFVVNERYIRYRG